MDSPLIPENEQGIETNTETTVSLESEQKAFELFSIAKSRLKDVNKWHDVAGSATAFFQLTDNKGNPVFRQVRKDDHFKIDIPAPGLVTGEGFDWVKVEAIEEKDNEIAIRVRPSSNPLNDLPDVAHFFDDSATSSFIIRKHGNSITAGVYGRNEKPNTHTEHTIDKIRNAAVATGAIAGFSKIQWKSLVNGFVSVKEN